MFRWSAELLRPDSKHVRSQRWSNTASTYHVSHSPLVSPTPTLEVSSAIVVTVATAAAMMMTRVFRATWYNHVRTQSETSSSSCSLGESVKATRVENCLGTTTFPCVLDCILDRLPLIRHLPLPPHFSPLALFLPFTFSRVTWIARDTVGGVRRWTCCTL